MSLCALHFTAAARLPRMGGRTAGSTVHTMSAWKRSVFNGIDSVSISHRLGHAHVSTTTDIYSHEAKLHWDQGGGGTYQRPCGGCDIETGEDEAEGSRGLRETLIKNGIRIHLGAHPILFYQYCFTNSLDSFSVN